MSIAKSTTLLPTTLSTTLSTTLVVTTLSTILSTTLSTTLATTLATTTRNHQHKRWMRTSIPKTCDLNIGKNFAIVTLPNIKCHLGGLSKPLSIAVSLNL